MKTNGRFTLNLEARILEKDENSFVKDLLSLSQVGYYFPHFYSDNENISSYGGLVIETNNEDIETRIDKVKKVYGIDPDQVLYHNGIYHIVFNLDKGIDISDYKRYQKSLEFIYFGKAIDYHFYYDEYSGFVKIISEGKSSSILFNVLASIHSILDEKKVERDFNKHNLKEYNKANKLTFSEVCEKLGDTEYEGHIDDDRNMHIPTGRVFDYVVNYLNSREDTFSFFNNNFGLNFTEQKDLGLIMMGEGVSILDGKGFYSDNQGYFSLNNKDEPTRVTDFYVKVHYRLIKSEKEKVFIVSLINEVSDERTEKIEWINATSKNPFSDYIQKLGNFHFTGNPNFISALHKRICDAKVCDIEYIRGYGFHKKHGIIILKNGIYDIKEKIFTPRVEGDKYYFNYDGKGYYPSDMLGNSLLDTIGNFVPSLNSTKLIELDDVFELMKILYRDNSGIFLIMFVFGILGNGLFSKKVGEFPIFFIRGLTGSGKSKYSEILQYIFGTGKPSEFGSSSPFTMTMLFTYLKDLPYFISEYRENSKDKDNKVSILRSNYDGSSQTKGRPDQSVLKYDYSAIPIIDGQEMISDPALRTRSIQLQFLSKHKIEGNFDDMYNEKKDILQGLMYTYLSLSNGEKYNDYLREGFKLFTSQSNRIKQNLACIYAGCMIIDKNRKDLYIEILQEVLEFQNIDLKENGDSQEIINVISKFLESDRDNYDSVWDIPKEKCVMISWGKIDEYIRARRISLTLKSETYKSSLENIGYPICYKDDEVEGRLRYGIMVPYDNIPQEFLINSEFYSVSKRLRMEKEGNKLTKPF